MKKTLHDRLYLRYGLFHHRYGRHIAYMLEFAIVAALSAIAMIFVTGAMLFIYGMVDGYLEAEAKAEKAEHQRVQYERMLIECLNGGVVGKAGDKLVVCDQAEVI